MPHFRIKDTVKKLNKITPMEKILPIKNGRLEVKITGALVPVKIFPFSDFATWVNNL